VKRAAPIGAAVREVLSEVAHVRDVGAKGCRRERQRMRHELPAGGIQHVIAHLAAQRAREQGDALPDRVAGHGQERIERAARARIDTCRSTRNCRRAALPAAARRLCDLHGGLRDGCRRMPLCRVEQVRSGLERQVGERRLAEVKRPFPRVPPSRPPTVLARDPAGPSSSKASLGLWAERLPFSRERRLPRCRSTISPGRVAPATRSFVLRGTTTLRWRADHSILSR
jgi:hypothetical protein